VLIYTEYTDSLDALAKYLNVKGVGEILTMTGDDNNAVRRRTTERFVTGSHPNCRAV